MLHTGSLYGLLTNEERLNLSEGLYYYISVCDFDDDSSIKDIEYIGKIVDIEVDEIGVIVEKQRNIIEGNEQEWFDIDELHLTFHSLDINSPLVRPCVRFYRPA